MISVTVLLIDSIFLSNYGAHPLSFRSFLCWSIYWSIFINDDM